MSRYDEAAENREAFYEALSKIRVKSIRQLLEIYYLAYVEPVQSFQLGREGDRKPRVYPGLNAVMGFLDCNKTCAMDYLYALGVLEDHIVSRRMVFLGREPGRYNRPQDVWSKELRPRGRGDRSGDY